MSHEPYRDYISRRMKEDKPEKTVDERDNEIFQLKQRIQRQSLRICKEDKDMKRKIVMSRHGG